MRLFPAFLALALLLNAAPASAQSTEPDPYADTVYEATNQVLAPQNALGAPDTAYADFLDSTDNHHLTLDMGEGEEGIGDLAFIYRRFDVQAVYRVKLMDDQFITLKEQGGFFPGSENAGTLTIPYDGDTPYRYVRFDNREEERWSVDAVEAADHVGSDAQQEPAPEEEPEEEPAETLPVRGDLIKLPDDGDNDTTFDSTVYVVGAQGKRHAFPTQTVFFSWFQNFDAVEEVSKDTMSSLPLGKNVTMRPGSYLVKLTNDPKTYAVEPGGVLRHIANESVAEALWGEEWNQRVADIPDVFFGNYAVGERIDSVVHPEGTIGLSPDGDRIYIRNGTYLTIPETAWNAMRFRTVFYAPIQQGIFDLYTHAGDMEAGPDLRWPY